MIFHSSFVLHTYHWRESSLIVEFFTEKEGRVSAVAKGARRATSNLRGLLIPFNRILIRYSKKGELRSLMSAEWDERGEKKLAGEQLFTGFYINELILKLVQKNDPFKVLFSAYESTLKSLALLPELQEVHLRRFEFAMLKEIGVFPDFSEYIISGKNHLYLTPEHGVVSEIDIHNRGYTIGYDYFPIGSDLLKILKMLTFDFNQWVKIFQNKKYWMRLKSLLRFLLNGQLNSVELKSRRIMREINEFSKGIKK